MSNDFLLWLWCGIEVIPFTQTWMPPHTPCVATPEVATPEAATPRAASPQPGPSGTALSEPRRRLPVSDSQIELMLGDSGSEDDDVFGSSDEGIFSNNSFARLHADHKLEKTLKRRVF